MQSQFIKSASQPSDFPEQTLPEVCFVGRSNSGKSSLLNVLMNRKGLARTSATPGRTQLVNFFQFYGRLVFVDLPGYGYSATSDQARRNWRVLVESYLNRDIVRYVLFLLDIRRDLESEDRQILDYIGKTHKIVVVATKSDKLSHTQVSANKKKLEEQLKYLDVVNVFVVSAKRNQTIESLRDFILEGL